jgi:hypothetical protein
MSVLHLGNENAIQPRPSIPNYNGEIVCRPLRVDGVYPNADRPAPVSVAFERRYDGAARLLLGCRRDRVLEVEEDFVGGQRGRRGHHLG